MHGIEAVLAEILRAERARSAGARRLPRADHAPRGRTRAAASARSGVARDVIVIHLGAQSNLYAALAWTLVDLLLHPEQRGGVARRRRRLLERCANESIRMAQRSLTLRQVMQPLSSTTAARSTASRRAS